MKNFFKNLFFRTTTRTPAELPKEQFLFYRSINNFNRPLLREWRTR